MWYYLGKPFANQKHVYLIEDGLLWWAKHRGKSFPVEEDQQRNPHATIFAVYAVSILKLTADSSIKIVFPRRIFLKNQKEQVWRNVILSTCFEFRPTSIAQHNRKWSCTFLRQYILDRFLLNGQQWIQVQSVYRSDLPRCCLAGQPIIESNRIRRCLLKDFTRKIKMTINRRFYVSNIILKMFVILIFLANY